MKSVHFCLTHPVSQWPLMPTPLPTIQHRLFLLRFVLSTLAEIYQRIPQFISSSHTFVTRSWHLIFVLTMDNARPSKRKRLDSPLSSSEEAVEAPWAPIPAEILLISLPALLLHPPTHRHHTRSLSLSLYALRRCLLLSNLDKGLECRILTAISEIGLILGFSEPGVESEVEKALTKAVSFYAS